MVVAVNVITVEWGVEKERVEAWCLPASRSSTQYIPPDRIPSSLLFGLSCNHPRAVVRYCFGNWICALSFPDSPCVWTAHIDLCVISEGYGSSSVHMWKLRTLTLGRQQPQKFICSLIMHLLCGCHILGAARKARESGKSQTGDLSPSYS